MQDDFFTQTRAAPAVRPSARFSARTIGAAMLLTFLLGCAIVGWLAWRAGFDPRSIFRARPAATADQTNANLVFGPLAVTPSPVQAASGLPALVAMAPVPAGPVAAVDPADARLAALEQRLTRLDLQAQAAAGNAGRAEGMLVAYAARRAIDRGAPLGYLADQLRLRFADAQPNAVETVIAASQQPVTVSDLSTQLDTLAPQLLQRSVGGSTWATLRHEFGQLFVIRHEDHPSPAPASRIERAHLLLTGGRIDAAIAEVASLPGAAAAQAWIGNARRLDGALRALDLLETTAILDPARLRDGTGTAIQQPSPAAVPATAN